MTNNEFLRPGIAAIVLAGLFPFYWFYEFVIAETELTLADYANTTSLSLADGLFLVLCALSIYLYLSFKRILHERENYRSLDLPLNMAIALSLVFYVGLTVLDAILILTGDQLSVVTQELLLTSSYLLLVGGTVALGVIDIMIAFILLRGSRQRPDLLRIFAIVTLIQGICGLSVIFALLVIFIFPISVLILATYFLAEPEMIEVV